MLVLDRAHNPFRTPTWLSSHHPNDDDSVGENDDAPHGSGVRGQIEGPYRDDPLNRADNQALSSQANGRAGDEVADRSPVVQPSRLHHEGSEWRDA